MSLLQAFPNCASVLHPNAFVFLFGLLPFNGSRSRSLPRVLGLLRVTSFLWEFQTRLSCSFLQTYSTSSCPTMCQVACQPARLWWVFVIFYRKLDVIFLSHKTWSEKWWTRAYLPSQLSFFSPPLSSSPSWLSFISMTSCPHHNHWHRHRDLYRTHHLPLSVFPSVAPLWPSGDESWRLINWQDKWIRGKTINYLSSSHPPFTWPYWQHVPVHSSEPRIRRRIIQHNLKLCGILITLSED